MAFVLDSSVAGAWFLPDEFSEIADELLDDISTNAPAVPSLFRHELRNLLLIAERRDRVTAFQVDEALTLVATLPISALASASPVSSASTRRSRA